MRANTITITRSKPKAWHSVLALVLAVCALAIPGTASAAPVDSGPYSSVNAITGGSDQSSQPTIARPNEGIVTPDHLHYGGPDQSSQTTIARPNEGTVTPDHLHYTGPAPVATSQPVASSGGFDWLSAAIGAAAAAALVALGGAVLLTVRRRTAASPSVAR